MRRCREAESEMQLRAYGKAVEGLPAACKIIIEMEDEMQGGYRNAGREGAAFRDGKREHQAIVHCSKLPCMYGDR